MICADQRLSEGLLVPSEMPVVIETYTGLAGPLDPTWDSHLSRKGIWGASGISLGIGNVTRWGSSGYWILSIVHV